MCDAVPVDLLYTVKVYEQELPSCQEPIGSYVQRVPKLPSGTTASMEKVGHVIDDAPCDRLRPPPGASPYRSTSLVGVVPRLRLALELLTNHPTEQGICRHSEPNCAHLAGAAAHFESSVGDLTCRPPHDCTYEPENPGEQRYGWRC